MSMYEMEIGQIAGLTKEQKIVQKRHFEDKLEEILQHSNNSECHDKYCFLSFEGKNFFLLLLNVFQSNMPSKY